MALRLIRALPGERPLLSPLPRQHGPAGIDARVAAPGPHDFAVRCASVSPGEGSPSPAAAIASRAQRYVTIAHTPLLRGAGRGTHIMEIRILVKRNICKYGLDKR